MPLAWSTVPDMLLEIDLALVDKDDMELKRLEDL